MSKRITETWRPFHDNSVAIGCSLLPRIETQQRIDQIFELLEQAFLLGVHSAFTRTLMAHMKRRGYSQQDIAEQVGLRDRTSISKMITSNRMDGIRLTAGFYLEWSSLQALTQDACSLSGFASATAALRRIVQSPSINANLEENTDIAPYEIDLLRMIAASSEWETAVGTGNPERARQAAQRMLVRLRAFPRDILSTENLASLDQYCNARLEQQVQALQDLVIHWGNHAAIAVYLLEDRLPTVDGVEQ